MNQSPMTAPYPQERLDALFLELHEMPEYSPIPYSLVIERLGLTDLTDGSAANQALLNHILGAAKAKLNRYIRRRGPSLIEAKTGSSDAFVPFHIKVRRRSDSWEKVANSTLARVVIKNCKDKVYNVYARTNHGIGFVTHYFETAPMERLLLEGIQEQVRIKQENTARENRNLLKMIESMQTELGKLPAEQRHKLQGSLPLHE